MSVVTPPRSAPPAEPLARWPAPPARRRSGIEGVWRGPETDPAWVRPVFFGLLVATAALYLWDLGASGWANSYYAAAVQAGTKSWKAFFFGSTDAANFVTVDKTPASLWPMEVSARIFGVNSWSILVPQALEGVAAVGLLFAAVKRWFSPVAALLAGAVLALTPIAALMFRFNNPDSLLVLLLVAAAYTLTRALEDARMRWIVATGACVGFAFLAKELQAFLVLPAFGAVYLLAGPPKLGRRTVDVLVLGVSTIVAGGWWVAIVSLWPASSRPYIGGSQNNSFWNVLFGYNGFGRLTGNESGSVGGGPTGTTGRWGPTGWTRMFNSQFGGQISWLLPAALLFLVGGLVLTARRPRTDRTRAALVLWGGWLLVTGIAFSLGQGIIHEYYSVALAPAIGALVGIGASTFWARRDNPIVRVFLGFVLGIGAVWAYVLLHRTPAWNAPLRSFVLVGGLVVALAITVAPELRGRSAIALAVAAGVVGLSAPAAYALSTVTTAHDAALPTAGPAVANRGFGPGGGLGRFGPGANPGGNRFPIFGGGFPGGGFPAGGFAPRGRGGGLGGLLNGSTPGPNVTARLKDSAGYRWTAAAIGANNAAGYQLASGQPIMAIGGFNGTDPTPTLAQFQQYVREHKIHYFIGGGGGFGGGGFGGPAVSNTSSEISQWVQQNFTAQTVDGVTIYDLSS